MIAVDPRYGAHRHTPTDLEQLGAHHLREPFGAARMSLRVADTFEQFAIFGDDSCSALSPAS